MAQTEILHFLTQVEILIQAKHTELCQMFVLVVELIIKKGDRIGKKERLHQLEPLELVLQRQLKCLQRS